MTTKQPNPSNESSVNYGPLAVGLVGAMVTAAAFIALIIAGLAAADLFPATSSASDALQDRGIWSATRAWANPLGIAGLAVLLGGAVPYALYNIRNTISYRRDSMASALPAILTKDATS
jgi:hypothetical protein